MITLAEIRCLRGRAAIEKFVRRRYKDDPAAFVQDLSRSLNELLHSDLHRAGRFVDSARQCFKFLPEHLRPRLVAMEGRYQHRLGNWNAALKSYQQARQMHRRQRDTEAVARIGLGLMDVHMYLGDYHDAIAIGRHSLRFFRRRARDTDVAKVLVNMGNVYHRMDNNRMAMRYYDRARDILEAEGGTALAIVDYNRANIYANLNQLESAAQLYESSAQLYRQAGMDIAEAQARYSLAYLYFLEDRYTAAIKTFEEVQKRFSRLGDSKSAAAAMLDLVEIDLRLNQFGSAISLGEQVIKQLAALGMRYELAKAHFFAGWARMRLGDHGPATAQFRKSYSLFSRERNTLWQGMIGIARSQLYRNKRQFSRAAEAAQQAMVCFASSGDVRRQTDAEIDYTEALVAAGRVTEALGRAARIRKRRLTGLQTYRLHDLFGRCYYAEEDYQRALQHSKAAVVAAEHMLAGLYPDEIQLFFLLDKFDSYQMVANCLLKLGRINDAFVSSLSALASLNRRFTAGRRSRVRVPRRLLEKRQELRTALKKIEAYPAHGSGPARLALSYTSLEQKLWACERRIRSYQYSARTRKRQPPVGLSEVRRFIRPDEAAISFFAQDEEVVAFSATSATTQLHRLNMSYGELNVTLRKLHFLLERSVLTPSSADATVGPIDSYLTCLYRSLLEPLEESIGNRNLVVVTDGVFGQIPFAALRLGRRRYLYSQRAVRIVASPQDILDRGVASESFTGSRHAVFAVSSDLLPAIDFEAAKVGEIFTACRVFTGARAGLSNLSKQLGTADGFIHIAAHASRSSENPLFSRILMHDGPFFPFDLFGRGILAQLVTLSGCQTAAPGLYYGNSFSLAKAFYQAGSRYVLASLWPVSDKVSMMFMTEFYRALHRSRHVYVAYAEAIDRTQVMTGHPALWGAFVLLGL